MARWRLTLDQEMHHGPFGKISFSRTAVALPLLLADCLQRLAPQDPRPGRIPC